MMLYTRCKETQHALHYLVDQRNSKARNMQLLPACHMLGIDFNVSTARCVRPLNMSCGLVWPESRVVGFVNRGPRNLIHNCLVRTRIVRAERESIHKLHPNTSHLFRPWLPSSFQTMHVHGNMADGQLWPKHLSWGAMQWLLDMHIKSDASHSIPRLELGVDLKTCNIDTSRKHQVLLLLMPGRKQVRCDAQCKVHLQRCIAYLISLCIVNQFWSQKTLIIAGVIQKL